MDESLSILQKSTKDSSLPKEIRVNFVTKVYGIMFTMLLITFGLASPFVFDTKDTLHWMKAHIWLFWICLAFLLFQQIFHMCMMMEMCMGNGNLFKNYIWMFKTVPWNYLYLLVYASVMGLVIGVITTAYTMESVCMVFVLTAGILAGLTVYAVTTKNDMTDMGGYIVVAILGLLFMSFIGFFFPIGSVFHRIIGGIGAIIFGFIIVYDTQLIFGSISTEERQFEFTLDMYAFAAFHLYLDFINFFLYMLRLLGDRN